jgi:hypothetical protein
VRFLIITSHGIINYPQKESCIIYVTEEFLDEIDKKENKSENFKRYYKFLNLEHFSRECAK